MPRYQIEPFSEVVGWIALLVDQHWTEVGEDFGGRFARDINYAVYHQLEREGRLLVITARDNRGRVFGYVVGAVGTDLHRVTRDEPPQRVMAFSALVNYIVPEMRGHARALTKAVERLVVERTGRVTTISYRTKRANDAGQFFEAMGYAEMEVTRTKVVEQPALRYDAPRATTGGASRCPVDT